MKDEGGSLKSLTGLTSQAYCPAVAAGFGRRWGFYREPETANTERDRQEKLFKASEAAKGDEGDKHHFECILKRCKVILYVEADVYS
jgi:hypothetical protein